MDKMSKDAMEMTRQNRAGIPSLHLVWQGIAGGLIGTVIGTWIYPDIGTLIGTTLGIILGVIFGKLVDASDLDTTDEPTPILETSQKAKLFFESLNQSTRKKFNLTLASTRKYTDLTSPEEGEKYKLHLFEQAITSRGTGVFPHHNHPRFKTNREKNKWGSSDK